MGPREGWMCRTRDWGDARIESLILSFSVYMDPFSQQVFTEALPCTRHFSIDRSRQYNHEQTNFTTQMKLGPHGGKGQFYPAWVETFPFYHKSCLRGTVKFCSKNMIVILWPSFPRTTINCSMG